MKIRQDLVVPRAACMKLPCRLPRQGLKAELREGRVEKGMASVDPSATSDFTTFDTRGEGG